MGIIKDIVIQYEETYGTIEQANKKIIFDEIASLTAKVDKVNPELTEFIKDVFPVRPNVRYWLYSDYKGQKLNYYYTDIEEYIKTLTALSKEENKANLYIVPVAFDDKYLDSDTWRLDCYAHYTNTIFVDIDEVDFDIKQLPKDLVKELFAKYPLLNKCKPNYIVKSGHGFHLYFLIDTLDIYQNKHLRQELTEKLITYFKADFACKNASRIMRCPFSFNCKKEDKIQTDIIYKHKSSHNIKRLEIFNVTPDEVETYHKECNEKVSAKRKATMIKNGTSTGRKNDPEKAGHKTTISKAKSPEKVQPESKNYPLEYINTYHPHARYRNILKDVHNYFIRHSGSIEGHRHNFILINSWLLYNLNYTEEEAVFYNIKYFPSNFKDEAITITKNVYKHAKDYHYANSTIAALLDFTEQDFYDSYCSYDDDSVKQRRIDNNKRHATNQKVQRGKAERTALIKNRIKEYMASGWKYGSTQAVAIEFEISERTVQLYKKQIEAGE